MEQGTLCMDGNDMKRPKARLLLTPDKKNGLTALERLIKPSCMQGNASYYCGSGAGSSTIRLSGFSSFHRAAIEKIKFLTEDFKKITREIYIYEKAPWKHAPMFFK